MASKKFKRDPKRSEVHHIDEWYVEDKEAWLEEAAAAGIEGLTLQEAVRGAMMQMPDFMTIPDPIVVVCKYTVFKYL